MSKYLKAIEELKEAKLIISDVQRYADDDDINDIVDVISTIDKLQAKFAKKDKK